jgi:ribosomal protein L16 Arg81 hydroxylase
VENLLLKARIELGEDAEKFVRSKLGEAVIAIAEGQANAAYNELSRISPWRKRRISQLQSQIWRAENFQQWLAEIITEGRHSLELLEGEDK